MRRIIGSVVAGGTGRVELVGRAVVGVEIGVGVGGLLHVVVVEVLADQVLHVEATGCEDSFEVYGTEADWHLPLVVELRDIHLRHVGLLGLLLGHEAVGLSSLLWRNLLSKHVITLPSRYSRPGNFLIVVIL